MGGCGCRTGARPRHVRAHCRVEHAGHVGPRRQPDAAVHDRVREQGLDGEDVVLVLVGDGDVLRVGGDVGRHRDTAGGDVLDEAVGVADGWPVGVGEVVGDRRDDVGRADPEERHDDRVAIVRVCGVKPFDEPPPRLAHGAVLLVEDDVAGVGLQADRHALHGGRAAARADGVAARRGQQGGGQDPRKDHDRRPLGRARRHRSMFVQPTAATPGRPWCPTLKRRGRRSPSRGS